MDKIAAMGDKESVGIFSSVGIDVFYFENDSEKAQKKLSEIAEDYGVIFITEPLAKELQKQIDKYAESVTPAIILIPSVKNNTGEALKHIRNSVIKAVGADMSFDI